MRRTRLNRTTTAVSAIVLAAVAGLAGLRVWAGNPAVTPTQKGARLFAESGCIQCHHHRSRESKMGPGLDDLFDRETLPASGRPATAENVRQQLVDPYQHMPSFADRLSEEERTQIVAFLRRL